MDLVGESACDDAQMGLFCPEIGYDVVLKEWDCLLLVMEESGFDDALRIEGEVALWACDANVGLTADAGRRLDGGELFNISIRVGREAGGEDGEGAAWKSAKSSSIEVSACQANESKQKSNHQIQSRKAMLCWSWWCWWRSEN